MSSLPVPPRPRRSAKSPTRCSSSQVRTWSAKASSSEVRATSTPVNGTGRPGGRSGSVGASATVPGAGPVRNRSPPGGRQSGDNHPQVRRTGRPPRRQGARWSCGHRVRHAAPRPRRVPSRRRPGLQPGHPAGPPHRPGTSLTEPSGRERPRPLREIGSWPPPSRPRQQGRRSKAGCGGRRCRPPDRPAPGWRAQRPALRSPHRFRPMPPRVPTPRPPGSHGAGPRPSGNGRCCQCTRTGSQPGPYRPLVLICGASGSPLDPGMRLASASPSETSKEESCRDRCGM